MMNYIPDQPFFELTTKGFESRFGSPNGLLAQYYSFEMTPLKEPMVIAVPDGTIDILFTCTPTKTEAQVCGSVKKGSKVKLEQGNRYFGARFFPGAAEQLLECPLDQFTEKQVELLDVQKNAKRLINKIGSSASFEERVRHFENYYLKITRDKGKLPWLVSYMLNEIDKKNGEIRIQELADKTGYSTRHIHNQFKQHVGIPPKLYIRILRFQHCFGLLRSSSASDFTTLAVDAGYYDQAHFIKEFKEFSLNTPTQIFC